MGCATTPHAYTGCASMKGFPRRGSNRAGAPRRFKAAGLNEGLPQKGKQ